MGARLALCLVLCLQVLAAAGGARPPAMFVFGSSIVDVGNNNYLPGPGVARANRPFNGIDFPGSIPTGRFSNGYNTADYIGMYIHMHIYLYINMNRAHASKFCRSPFRACDLHALQRRTWASR